MYNVSYSVEAFGCPNPDIPDNTIFERRGNRALITCKSKDVQWEITCRNGEWQGDYGKCSEGEHQHDIINQVLIYNNKYINSIVSNPR